jgi:excinuclease ABC subunit A
MGSDLKKEVEVTFNDKSIHDVLTMTIDDAVSFLKKKKTTKNNSKIKTIARCWFRICN